MQSQVPPSSPSQSLQVVNPTNPGGIDILRPQEQQRAGQSPQLINDGPLSLAPCRYGAPLQDVPASYVTEIHSGAQTKAPAITSISLGHVSGTCASTNTPATGAMGLTLDATAPLFPNTESMRAIEEKTGTKGTPSPVPLIDTSRQNLVPLPTPINVTKLEEVLREHPDPVFVARLCSFFRTGADIGFTGPRVAMFSNNLPTALSQPDIVSENLTKEVALGRLCMESLSSMLLTFKNLGIPVALNKTQGPDTVLEFMGVVLDSDKMEARLPADKVERILNSSPVVFIQHRKK
ncbi:hypothetical protein ACROYT_G032514 [Oculina patagonica]